jgi:hypothetical protein
MNFQEQFQNKPLTDSFELNRDIQALSGARQFLPERLFELAKVFCRSWERRPVNETVLVLF